MHSVAILSLVCGRRRRMTISILVVIAALLCARPRRIEDERWPSSPLFSAAHCSSC
jgi:hypothetical protein